MFILFFWLHMAIVTNTRKYNGAYKMANNMAQYYKCPMTSDKGLYHVALLRRLNETNPPIDRDPQLAEINGQTYNRTALKI